MVACLPVKGFLNSLLQQMTIVFIDGQKLKQDEFEVAQPLEDYSAYANSSATDNNKVCSASG